MKSASVLLAISLAVISAAPVHPVAIMQKKCMVQGINSFFIVQFDEDKPGTKDPKIQYCLRSTPSSMAHWNVVQNNLEGILVRQTVGGLVEKADKAYGNDYQSKCCLTK